MSKQDYLAKSGEKIQTIEEHTQEVLNSLDSLLSVYGSFFTDKEKQLFRLACEYHDLGKMNKKFQDKLRKKLRKIYDELPHGVVSVFFLDKKKLLAEGLSIEEFRCLVTAIMHHHTRRFDLGSVNLRQYVKEFVQQQANDYFGVSTFRLFPNNVNVCLFNDDKVLSYNHQEWLKYVLIKGILNKADYNASNPKELLIERQIPTGEASLKHAILAQVGTSLYPAQAFLRDHSEENVVLVAPAGSGKTEGSLLWAGESKTFFALPLKVSSNSIYDRVRNRYGFEEVALLHSDALSYQMESENEEVDVVFQRYEEMQGLSPSGCRGGP